MFNGCSPAGDVIIIENISQRKSYDLTGWYIERETDSQPYILYVFKHRFILPPMTTIELWSRSSTPTPIASEAPDQTFVSVRTNLSSWNKARLWSNTKLFDSTGREKAIFSHRTLTSDSIDLQTNASN